MAASKIILVTGANGFVGRQVVALLASRGYQVRGLVRTPGTLPRPSSLVQEVIGDILQPETLASAATGCTGIIHLVGIIRETPPKITFTQVHVEGTRNMLDVARIARCRYVHMSALGTRANAVAAYHQTKWAAEELVRSSGLDWTIFRPSLILGEGGEFTTMLRRWSLGQIPPYWFMPYFGGGFFGQSHPTRIQPVTVETVAAAFSAALSTPATIHKTYDLPGPLVYTWPEMLRLASQFYRGRPKWTLGIPTWWAYLLARLPLPLPFTRDQVLMSREDNTGDPAPLLADLPQLRLQPCFIPDSPHHHPAR